ncbi:MAG: hypothetical protein QG675_268 [Patescibacteria group bacterium]|nr:hypothetical protein [Patescibacteria group bacterium]
MSKQLVKGSYRDHEWLENLLADIWFRYFNDIEQSNDVYIRYGRKAKRRLGSIGISPSDRNSTIITINPIYQDLEIPEYVVIATIVHEMTHYAHGFNSPHDQKHQHPHSGGVIRREFAERGLEDLYIKQKNWLKSNWQSIIDKYFVENSNLNTKKSTYVVKSPWWLR